MWFKTLLKGTFLLALLAGLAAGAVWVQVNRHLDQPLVLGESTEYTLERGQSALGVVRQWQQQGWIEGDLWIRLGMKLRPELTAVKSGTYQLAPAMSLANALSLLVSGQEKQFSITLLEGETRAQWLEVLHHHPKVVKTLPDYKAMDAALGEKDSSIEGMLYPDTYAFVAGTSELEILQRAHGRMVSALDKAWQERDTSLPLKNPYEMLILASIVEKETGLAEERGLVASVFVNRLRKRMRLQTDPTVIYGMGDDYKGDITRKALDTWTPYNTYRIKGLPPTPIANPSLAALQAVAKPKQSDYLYFVATGAGGHHFSKTLREHNNAVNKYIRKRQ